MHCNATWCDAMSYNIIKCTHGCTLMHVFPYSIVLMQVYSMVWNYPDLLVSTKAHTYTHTQTRTYTHRNNTHTHTQAPTHTDIYIYTHIQITINTYIYIDNIYSIECIGNAHIHLWCTKRRTSHQGLWFDPHGARWCSGWWPTESMAHGTWEWKRPTARHRKLGASIASKVSTAQQGNSVDMDDRHGTSRVGHVRTDFGQRMACQPNQDVLLHVLRTGNEFYHILNHSRLSDGRVIEAFTRP